VNLIVLLIHIYVRKIVCFFGYNTRNSSEQNSDVRDRRQFLEFAPKMKIFMWLNKCYKTN